MNNSIMSTSEVIEYDIYICIFKIQNLDHTTLRDLTALLDKKERTKLLLFNLEQRRNEFIIAHSLKRKMLSAIEPQVQPKDWSFDSSIFGKPMVLQKRDLHFNLSHSAGLIACAVSKKVNIGIDAEAINRKLPVKLALKFCSDFERKWVSSLSPDNQNLALLKLWTLKEAWVKTTGLGLSHSTKKSSFNLNDPNEIEFTNFTDDACMKWYFKQWTLDTHIVSLGWYGTKKNIQLRTLKTDDLISL